MAVAAAVRVFKRATSLGGVESLLEHRRSTEGPSSPVPEDLLRLSIGLEDPDDLIRDLEEALHTVAGAGAAGAPAVPSHRSAASPGASTVAAAVAAAIERSVAPLVIARGGSVRLVSVDDGVVTLEASGSPGAVVPATPRIEALLQAAVPEVAGVRVVWPRVESTRPAESDELTERVRRVLDDEVNPATAAHRGRATLVNVTAGRVRIRLEGGCQGCSLAEVTVRQGIESILRKHVPEVVAIVDITDHDAGTEPFFAPGKR